MKIINSLINAFSELCKSINDNFRIDLDDDGTMHYLYRDFFGDSWATPPDPYRGISITQFFNKLNGHMCSYEYNQKDKNTYVYVKYLPMIFIYNNTNQQVIKMACCGLVFKDTAYRYPDLFILEKSKNIATIQPVVTELLELMQQLQIGYFNNDVEIITQFWKQNENDINGDHLFQAMVFKRTLVLIYACLEDPYHLITYSRVSRMLRLGIY